MTGCTELEVKLAVTPADVRRLCELVPLSDWPDSRERQQSVYFDTRRHDLRKAGLTLRVRKSDGSTIQTMKTRSGGAGLFARDEWESAVPTLAPQLDSIRDCVPAALADAVANELVPYATIDSERTKWTVATPPDLVEVSLDQGVVSAGKLAEGFTEIELELKGGSPRALFDFWKKLARSVPLRVDVLSKLELAEAIAAGRLGKAAKAERIDVEAGMTAAEGLAAIILSCMRQFRLNEEVLRSRHQGEAVHQLHVATRRLQTALFLFEPIAKGRRHRKLMREAQRVSRLVGRVRDFDIVLNLLSDTGSNLELLEHRRDRAYRRLVAELQTRRVLAWVMKLVRWVTIGNWRNRAGAKAPLSSFLEWRLDEWRAGFSEETPTMETMTRKERHRFRIRVKRLRYALDFSRRLFPDRKPARKAFSKVLEALQSKLGLLNDRWTMRRIQPDLAAIPAELANPKIDADLRKDAQADFEQLLGLKPYWRTISPRPPEADAARRPGEAKRTGASRTPAPRSAGCARG